jgi:hypothetical protein
MHKGLPYGKKIWAFSGGHIPALSKGPEPEFTSHDKISILNASAHDAKIEIRIFYTDRDPVVFRSIEVRSQRVRKIKFNDLIDPLPVPLDTSFGFTVSSDTEVIVQFSRMNTMQDNLASFCTTPFYKPE